MYYQLRFKTVYTLGEDMFRLADAEYSRNDRFTKLQIPNGALFIRNDQTAPERAITIKQGKPEMKPDTCIEKFVMLD